MSIQFVHLLETHEHEVCKDTSIKHLHEIENECEFNHFIFKPTTLFTVSYFKPTEIIHTNEAILDSTSFLETLQNLSNTSRGPPITIV